MIINENEAPRSPARAGRGIRAKFTLPFIPIAHAAQAPALREPQGILTKANKKAQLGSFHEPKLRLHFSSCFIIGEP
jgi:hypothetical protein